MMGSRKSCQIVTEQNENTLVLVFNKKIAAARKWSGHAALPLPDGVRDCPVWDTASSSYTVDPSHHIAESSAKSVVSL